MPDGNHTAFGSKAIGSTAGREGVGVYWRRADHVTSFGEDKTAIERSPRSLRALDRDEASPTTDRSHVNRDGSDPRDSAFRAAVDWIDGSGARVWFEIEETLELRQCAKGDEVRISSGMGSGKAGLERADEKLERVGA